MLEKLRDKAGKLDKKALGMAVGLMLISWAALPIVYFLLVRKKKRGEEVKDATSEESTEEEWEGTEEEK